VLAVSSLLLVALRHTARLVKLGKEPGTKSLCFIEGFDPGNRMPDPPEISRCCSSLAVVPTGKLQLAHFNREIPDIESALTRIMHGIFRREMRRKSLQVFA
jgi:hypothetical protein